MSAKHAPGPWRKNQWGELIDAAGSQVVLCDSGIALGASGIEAKRQVQVANARLIAAAPDLLKALKDLRSVEFGHSEEDICAIRVAADEAIARAEAKQ